MNLTEQNVTRHKLSRRKFLRIASFAIGVPIFSEAIERVMYLGLKLGFINPDVTDTLTKQALDFTEKEVTSKNEMFRPMAKIIEEGIQLYRNRPSSKPVIYTRSSAFRDANYYADIMTIIANSSILPTPPDDAIEQLKNAFPPEAFYAYVSSNTRFGSFSEIYADGSGFEMRIKRIHPELFDQAGKILDYDTYFLVLNSEGKKEIEMIQKFIEELVCKRNAPISASEVLAFFLERNEGQLAHSIYDTAIFLKFISRNDFNDGKNNLSDRNTMWMTAHIKDEYHGPSYILSNDKKEQLNLIGKPYHSWNLVAMLEFFPTELIRVSGIYRQIITLKDQGLAKSRADMQTLYDMRMIEACLLEYL